MRSVWSKSYTVRLSANYGNIDLSADSVTDAQSDHKLHSPRMSTQCTFHAQLVTNIVVLSHFNFRYDYRKWLICRILKFILINKRQYHRIVSFLWKYIYVYNQGASMNDRTWTHNPLNAPGRLSLFREGSSSFLHYVYVIQDYQTEVYYGSNTLSPLIRTCQVSTMW